jgi:hypothetical protein
MKGQFKRFFSPNSIAKIKKDVFYLSKLQSDVKFINKNKIQSNVFPAIREGSLDFYYKGGKLFGYDDSKGFKTHAKYAAVINTPNNDYIYDKDLCKHKLISNFSNEYNRIKENCNLYSGIEAIGASLIYHKYSYTLLGSDIVVLDIEVSFQSLKEQKEEISSEENNVNDIVDILTDKLHNRKQDRIDLLLFNLKTKKLMFVELKHFSNKELKAKVGKLPPVYSQIKRYEKQISAKKALILDEYVKYVEAVNELFNLSLPLPKDICEDVTLLVFGFDTDLLKGTLTSNIMKNLRGIRFYVLGCVHPDTRLLSILVKSGYE